PVTKRGKARIAQAELVHYMPQRHLIADGSLVRLGPAPGRKWLFLYVGRTFPRFGAIVNHTRIGRRARAEPYVCIKFRGSDVCDSHWLRAIRRRPLDGALRVSTTLVTAATFTYNVVPAKHRATTPNGPGTPDATDR